MLPPVFYARSFVLIASLLLLACLVSSPANADPCSIADVTPPPGNRTNAGLMYDEARHEMILWGGSNEAGAMTNTWAWNGTTWTQRATTGAPATKFAYNDAARGVVVAITEGSMYEWNGSTWSSHPVSSPFGPYGNAFAYDSNRKIGVLFVGGASTYPIPQTWEWDGTLWTLKSTGGPSGRDRTALAFDANRNVVVLHGGQSATDSSILRDTWEWDGSTWTLRSQSGPPRLEHSLAYDGSRHVVRLFGGNSGSEVGGTLEWDGFVWRGNLDPGPQGRTELAMASDTDRNVVVLFGGTTFVTGSWGDCWESSGSGWSLRTSGSPSPRGNGGMVFDVARHVSLLAGGSGTKDTWGWDGVNWNFFTRFGTPDLTGQAMDYDSFRSVAVMFGGGVDQSQFSSSLTEWNGSGWASYTGPRPSARTNAAMAFDSRRGVSVLFGGASPTHVAFVDTWEWDGTSFTQRDVSGPPGGAYAMAYDERRGVAVLFGWSTAAETWEFDGNAWTKIIPEGGSPQSRYGHRMVYDSAAGVVLLSGGGVNNGSLSDIWSWNGKRWNLEGNLPVPVRQHFMSYDSDRQVSVVFGGHSYGPVGKTHEIPSCLIDSDNDNVPNIYDLCPESNIEPTVAVEDCTTEVTNLTVHDGCTMNDLINACAAKPQVHRRDFVRCVRQLAAEWRHDGLITLRDQREIVRCASQKRTP
ncbi:MAG: hypothetical protein HY287_14520 [Planctomycetes bacterium]|nr:hypothetical protein [Planctomycetota bacterium]MBI3835537.1 hypothetical protein [Planctomycetota bacterium]